MPLLPVCRPDGPRIRELIDYRGYTMAGFARIRMRRPTASDSVQKICAGATTRVSIELIRQIATGLRCVPGEISDWKNDDEDWDGPIGRIPPRADAA